MIALVDVHPELSAATREWAGRHDHEVVRLAGPMLPGALARAPDLCLLEARDERDVAPGRLRELAKLTRPAPLVVVAHRLAIDTVARLFRSGVADVIGLPCEPGDVLARATLHVTDPAGLGGHELVGQTSPMIRLRKEIAAVAPLQSTVLLTGETGSGKGVVARVLHRVSNRRRLPFVHVDCASLLSSVVESELFGHERGAFTGAVNRRTGRFEAAGSGTIFLDEISEIAPALQTKLLRVLQDRVFERIGSTRPLPMHARVVAASNRDLREEIRLGRFRADLYFRLNVFEIALPPLRERRDDLPVLVRHQLARIAARFGIPVPAVDHSFYEALGAHDWPGNVRELFNVLERIVIRCEGAALGAAHAEAVLSAAGRRRAVALADRPDDAPADERERVTEALIATGGNVARTARRLGIPRSTLRYRIQRLRLDSLIPDD